jgi:hypothetical protein
MAGKRFTKRIILEEARTFPWPLTKGDLLVKSSWYYFDPDPGLVPDFITSEENIWHPG